MKNAQMLKILVLGFILGATTGTAVAFVDIRNGNFSESFSDLKIRVSQGESIPAMEAPSW